MRYYYHQIQGDTRIVDDEGSEHPDLEAARIEALEAAREMMASAARAGWDIAGQSIEIVDGQCTQLALVPFTDVLKRWMPA